MRSWRILLVLTFMVGAIIATNVSAASAAGACGGGNNLGQMMTGWTNLGVLDDVALSTGQTPGLDGSAHAIVRGGVVATKVLVGGWVINHTCQGGTFERLSAKKYIPAGSLYFVPERVAPKPCQKGRVSIGWQANCGNKQLGNLLVRRLDCPPRVRPHRKVRVTVLKKARGGHGIFTIQWRAGHSRWHTKRIRSGKRYRVTTVRRNMLVRMREIRIPKTWKLIGRKVQSKRAHGRHVNFVIVNQKVKLTPPPPPTHPKPTPPTYTCPDGTIVNSPASCNVQQNTAKQHCEVDLRGDYDEAKNVCVITQVQGNCSIIVVVNGDGNVISTSGNELCTVQQPTPPPPPKTCEELGTCPRPPVSANARCTALTVTTDPAVNLKVNAVVTYTAQNATLRSVTYFWGDSSTSTEGPTASHTYSSPGTYTVYAVLTFSTNDGDITDTCAKKTITPKDSTGAPSTPTPPGGGGAGGDRGPSQGTGESCRLPDGSVGYKDQFGNCNSY